MKAWVQGIWSDGILSSWLRLFFCSAPAEFVFPIVSENRARYPIAVMCRVLGLPQRLLRVGEAAGL